MTPRLTGVLVGAALLVAAAGTVAATNGGSAAANGDSAAARPTPAATGDGRLVLISGRDDHGLLAAERVTLRDRPAADAVSTGQVPDGTLARVVEVRGNWLRVNPAEGASTEGWLDDFYLRGVVHLVGPPPTCTVPFHGGTLPNGEQATVLGLHDGRARVRINRTGESDWVDRATVREIVPEHCGAPTPDGKHEDQHSH